MRALNRIRSTINAANAAVLSASVWCSAATITVKDADQLRQALATQPAGSEFVLADGRYVGELVIPKRISGTATRPTILRAANAWKAELDPAGGYGDGIQCQGGLHDVVFRDLRITGAYCMGIRMTGTNHLTVDGCRIELCYGDGILASGTGHVFQYNLIQRCGLTKWDHGIYCAGDRYTIANNVIRGNFGWGIHGYSGRTGVPSMTRSLVVGNQIYDQKVVGLLIWDGGENLVFGNYSWGNGRANYQYEFPDATNRIFGNFEHDPARWPLRTVPEKTGGWPVATGVVATSQPE